MRIEDIKNILKQGEGVSVEFKKAKEQLPDNLFETVCAFLNRNGGTVLLGVNDDKSIDGVNPDKADVLCKNIVNLSNNPQKLFPTFLLSAEKIVLNNKTLIYVFVPISSQVHKTNGKIYDRSYDGDFELKTDDQIKQLYNRKSILYSENTIYPYLNQSHFVDGIVKKVRQIIKNNNALHPWNDLSDDDFFVTAGLYRTDLVSGLQGFTMSALLLFAKPEIIQSAIPHYKIDALLRVQNVDRYDDRENIRCNIVEAYEKLLAFVAKHLPDPFYLEGDQRISLRDKIFREIIANMLIHREYNNAYPSSLIIYGDRVETKNANKAILVRQLFPGKFEPFPKNPNIAQIFTQMGRSEELGTGVKNVFKYSKAYSGSDEIIFEENDVFITKIPLNNLLKNLVLTHGIIDDDTDNATDCDTDNVTEKTMNSVDKHEVAGLVDVERDAKNVTDTNGDVKNDTDNDTEGDTNNRLKKVIDLIVNNNKITTKEIAKELNVSQVTIKRDVEKLKTQSKIERTGTAKSGSWKVLSS